MTCARGPRYGAFGAATAVDPPSSLLLPSLRLLLAFAAFAALAALFVGVAARDALAQVGDARDALPGLVNVPVAGSMDRTGVAVATSAGYGYTEGVLGTGDHHDRLMGTIAASATPTRWLGLALRFDGRYDHDSDPVAGGTSGFVGDPRVFARVGTDLPRGFRLGGQLGLWLPGEQAPSIVLKAASLDVTAMAAYAPPDSRFVVAIHAGGRLDNSAESVSAPARLSASERLGLGVNGANGILSGAGLSYRATGQLELIGDISADWLVGSSAPAALESPIVVSIGGRLDANERDTVTLQLLLEMSPSERPSIAVGQPLVDVEPRLGAIFAVVLRPDLSEPHRESPLPEKAEPAAEDNIVTAAPTSASVQGSVTTASGAPLAHAQLRLTPPSGDVRTAETEADGGFEFDDVPLGSGELVVQAKGYASVERSIRVEAKASEVAIALEPAIPPAQIRGLVRDFAGKPVIATVVIEPMGTTASVGPDGSFAIDVNPGTYEVSIAAKGYAAQRRKVTVEAKGVTLLNVDLRSAR